MPNPDDRVRRHDINAGAPRGPDDWSSDDYSPTSGGGHENDWGDDLTDLRPGGLRPGNLLVVAATQRSLLGWIQAQLFVYFLLGLAHFTYPVVGPLMPIATVYYGATILVAIISLVASISLLRVRGYLYGPRIDLAISALTLVPCVGLVALLVATAKATRVLKERGVRVGFWGANMDDLPPPWFPEVDEDED